MVLVKPGPANALKLESTSFSVKDEGSDGNAEPSYWAGVPSEPDAEALKTNSGAAQLELLPLFAKLREDAADQQPEAVETEGYHWKGLLWQSLGFIAAEDTVRFFSDHYARHLVATGPYWRNYGISMTHWDMTRWSDGDDFLVDDIGHPMQGALSAYLEIQNSPTQRELQFSNTWPYWRSRLLGLAWSTVYSTQQKIGPLGEAAIGNAGGFTYPLHCPYLCTNPNAEYTNNTGWTDFIMTPAGGFVWVLGEDLIDRYISNRIQGDSTSIWPKIVRGALNPTRSGANLLRGKIFWYRDWQNPDLESPKVHFDNGKAEFIRSLPKYEIFPHYNGISLPVNTSTCTACRRWTSGGGVGFSYRVSRWVDFDSDFDYQPNASARPTNRAGGSALIATWGFRSGIVTPNYALKLSIRPGLVSYSQAQLAKPNTPNQTEGIGRVTHFAAALAINGDYGINRHLAIRGVFGNTPVRYYNYYIFPEGIGTPPYINWLSHEVFTTNENWNIQIGPVLRF